MAIMEFENPRSKNRLVLVNLEGCENRYVDMTDIVIYRQKKFVWPLKNRAALHQPLMSVISTSNMPNKIIQFFKVNTKIWIFVVKYVQGIIFNIHKVIDRASRSKNIYKRSINLQKSSQHL